MAKKENEVPQEAQREKVICKGIITDCIHVSNTNRLRITTDTTFVVTDRETGEEKESNVFGININKLADMLKPENDYISAADSQRDTATMTNPAIFRILLQRAEVVFVRELFTEGEEVDGATLDKDTWVTTKVKVANVKLNKVMEAQLMHIITEKPVVPIIRQNVAMPTNAVNVSDIEKAFNI